MYVKVGEVNEEDFGWPIDEDDMELVSVYIIDEVDAEYPEEEERKVYEFHAESSL